MEPVTHVLTGVCLARSGFNRKAAYATATMAIAAELPDIDTVWSLRGPVESLAHHRGITHTFVGVPVEAAALVAAVWGVHRWREIKKANAEGAEDAKVRAGKAETHAPVRWGWLYAGALAALLSHLLLDWTNNYGLRPFFPFDRHWFAGSFVFIFDPLIFLLLLGALLMPPLFGLVAGEVGAQKKPFRGRGWAVAALVGVAAWWGLRWVEHGKAVELAMQQSYAQPTYLPDAPAAGIVSGNMAPWEGPPVYFPAQRALANPEILSPFAWWTVMDFGPAYQLAEVDTRRSEVTVEPMTYAKPKRSLDVLLAEASPLGRAYMDWSPVPVVEEGGQPELDSLDKTIRGETTVTFQDLRFIRPEAGSFALRGAVTLDAAGKVVEQEMGGRTERRE